MLSIRVGKDVVRAIRVPYVSQFFDFTRGVYLLKRTETFRQDVVAHCLRLFRVRPIALEIGIDRLEYCCRARSLYIVDCPIMHDQVAPRLMHEIPRLYDRQTRTLPQ